MIHTVTCNPALDYVMKLDTLSTGAINRSTGESLSPGGKGINVSLVLKELGVPSVALGFVAGFTGEALTSSLDAAGIRHDFVRLGRGSTRVNVKLRVAGAPEGQEETDVNGKGPIAGGADLEALAAQVARLGEDDVLVLSGAGPAGADALLYRRLAEAAAQAGAQVAVDAEGELLTNALAARPFLIKPNGEELAAIAGCGPDDEGAVLACAQELAREARFVLLSLGGDGAVLVDAQGVVARAAAPQGPLVDSVGAGDSMMAGFLAGWLGGFPGAGGARAAEGAGRDPMAALELGVACGSATAFRIGLATRPEIEALRPQVHAIRNR